MLLDLHMPCCTFAVCEQHYLNISDNILIDLRTNKIVHDHMLKPWDFQQGIWQFSGKSRRKRTFLVGENCQVHIQATVLFSSVVVENCFSWWFCCVHCCIIILLYFTFPCC